jgi:hypothetical protein
MVAGEEFEYVDAGHGALADRPAPEEGGGVGDSIGPGLFHGLVLAVVEQARGVVGQMAGKDEQLPCRRAVRLASVRGKETA